MRTRDEKTRFIKEQIIGVSKEHKAGVPIAELCRKQGVSSASICKWKTTGIAGWTPARLNG